MSTEYSVITERGDCCHQTPLTGLWSLMWVCEREESIQSRLTEYISEHIVFGLLF